MPSDLEIAEIKAQLDRILASKGFARGRRMSQFLAFVVSEYLAGTEEHLKEITIGIKIFERKPGYDPSRDAIVRTNASRVREKLHTFYEDEGKQDPWRIELPTNQYIPRIERRLTGAEPDAVPEQSVASTDTKATPPLPSGGRLWRLSATALVFCLVILVAIAVLDGTRHTDFQIVGYRQLTRDGKVKLGPLVTDGQRIFFTEGLSAQNIVASVPVAGGDVSRIEMPLSSFALTDISLDQRRLLVMAAGRLLEWELQSRTLRQVPMPDGIPPIASASWHPSGKRIAVAARDQLWVFDPLAPSNAQRFMLPGSVEAPHWNTRGDRLRFGVADNRAETTSWWEMDGDRRSPHQIPTRAGLPREGHGSWAKDDHFYLFQGVSGERMWQSDLWLAKGFGEGARSSRLTNGPLAWDSPMALLDAQKIYAIGIQARGELVRLGMGKGDGKPLLSGLPGYEVDFSRDGQWAAFTRFPEHTIWRSTPDGTQLQQLTPPDIEAHQPHWSPDGMRIAFMGKKIGARHPWRVYVIPARGGPVEEVLPQGESQGVPTWSSNGDVLYFGSLLEMTGFEHAVIRQVDLRTRTASTIPAPIGLWSPRVSPNGKFLAAVSYDSRQLFVRDNANAMWRKLADMKFIEEPAWSPDSSLIQFYGKVSHIGGALFRIPMRTGRLEQVADVAGFEHVGDAWYGIAPDGTPLGFQGTTSYEIYALDLNQR